MPPKTTMTAEQVAKERPDVRNDLAVRERRTGRQLDAERRARLKKMLDAVKERTGHGEQEGKP